MKDSPHKEQSLSIFSQENLSPICHEKLSEKDLSILYGMRHYALAPLENHVGLYDPSIFARKSRLKLANILNVLKRIL